MCWHMKAAKWLMLLTMLIAACSSQKSAELLTVYDQDDRKTLDEADEPTAQFAPIVALLTRRHRVSPQMSQPLNAPIFGKVFGMCEDEPFFQERTLGDCTGFLISEDLLLTAGHCVKSELECLQRAIVLNYHTPQQPILQKSDLFTCSSVVARLEKSNGDLALIQLDRRVPLSSTQRLLSIEETPIGAHESIKILNHPFGVSLKVSQLESNPLHDGAYFSAKADVSGGSSGAPAIEPSSGRLAGVLIGGEIDLVWDKRSGCNRNKVCEGSSCGGEKFATISSVRRLLREYETNQRSTKVSTQGTNSVISINR